MHLHRQWCWLSLVQWRATRASRMREASMDNLLNPSRIQVRSMDHLLNPSQNIFAGRVQQPVFGHQGRQVAQAAMAPAPPVTFGPLPVTPLEHTSV